MIISTGMMSIAELGEAVKTIRDEGGEQFVLLKCTSSYPSTPKIQYSYNPHMRELIGWEVGLSDHTMGLGAQSQQFHMEQQL